MVTGGRINPLFPLFFLLSALLTGGCVDLRPETENPTPANLPEKFSLYNPVAAADTPWWLNFNNQELNRLISSGLSDNLSLQEAWARLAQARATAIKAGAGLYPAVTANGGAAHQRTDGSSTDSFSVGLSTGYELDLWGRVRAGAASAQLSADASQEAVNTLALSLSSQIAAAWLELISQRLQQQQLEQELELNTQLLELIKMRFTMSRATALDVYQQGQTITGLQGGLIKTRANCRLQLNLLALLTGRPAGGETDLIQDSFPTIPALPPTGLPADLLSRRPDIRAAGLRLQSAGWQVTAARAARLPGIDLSASLLYAASGLDLLLDNWILGLAASVSGTVFDGGALQAEVDRSRAVVDERLAAYRNTVLSAIREVEDALTSEQQYRQSLTNIDQQLSLTKMAYREATWRYLNGLSDFLPVLREQINLITFQLDRIKTRANLLKARISLYKALGGTWTKEPGAVTNKKPAGKQTP